MDRDMTRTLFPYKTRTQREILDALRTCIDVVSNENFKTTNPEKWFEAGLQLSRILLKENKKATTNFITHNLGKKRSDILWEYWHLFNLDNNLESKNER